MAFEAVCPGGLVDYGFPGELFEGSYYLWCDTPWATSGAGAAVVCSGGTVMAAPGMLNEGLGLYYVGCESEFTAGESNEPIPSELDPAVAGEMFVQGLGIAFAFWALGKVPALVMRLVR